MTTEEMREYIIKAVQHCDNTRFLKMAYYRIRNLIKILHL